MNHFQATPNTMIKARDFAGYDEDYILGTVTHTDATGLIHGKILQRVIDGKIAPEFMGEDFACPQNGLVIGDKRGRVLPIANLEELANEWI